MKRILLYIIILLNAGIMAAADTFTLKGNVKDNTGEDVIGATVMVSGAKNGTVTDIDGNYELQNVSAGMTVEVRYIGCKTQKKKIKGTGPLDFILEQDATLMDEVVVVGYGTQKKSTLSGAVSSIKAEELPTSGGASLGNMLRGRASGMDVKLNSAAPGGSLNIAIRGGLSGQAPLIIIDGVPQAGATNAAGGTMYSGAAKDGGLVNLNPDDIESIDILKDASAAAIYGSDASGGVILITTKRGKEGKPEVSYS